MLHLRSNATKKEGTQNVSEESLTKCKCYIKYSFNPKEGNEERVMGNKDMRTRQKKN